MVQKIPTFIVDSFTDEPFKGNPAGVCLLENTLEAQQMQHIAAELNLSETAFVRQIKTGFSIRYFSPKMEIPLCGHATLASAKVLVEQHGLDSIQFTTGGGLTLHVSKAEDGLVMQFPRYEVTPAKVPDGMLNALGLTSALNSVYNKETNILLIEIAGVERLRSLQPDFNALLSTHDSIHGVLLTCQGEDSGYDFHSRYFWPWSGSNEDPVTGATHTFMAPYWSQKLNKSRMRSFQASARTGFMELDLLPDKLLIKGKAVLVLEGEMIV